MFVICVTFMLMFVEKLFGKTLEELRAEAAVTAAAAAAAKEVANTTNDNANDENSVENLPSEKMYQKTRLDTL